MANQTIRISLRAYDHILLDKSTEKIVKTAKSTGAIISGPIPLPSKRSIYTILRSPHVNKKARDQFVRKIFSRSYYIENDIFKSLSTKNKDIIQFVNYVKKNLPDSVSVSVKFNT